MPSQYERPAFLGSFFKSQRGTRELTQEKADAKAAKAERDVKLEVKRIDGRCRWPEPHKCRFGIEAAHLHDESTGGDMTLENLITLCAWIHRRGPESVHGKQLEIRPLTKAGTRGPCAFYRKRYSEQRRGEFTWKLVARELAPGRAAE